jgi:hypothetical protein
MKEICIREKDTENINSTDFKVSILLTQNGFSYSVFHVETKRYYSLISKVFDEKEDFCKSVSGFLDTENVFTNRNDGINVVYSCRKSTIIPEALFEVDKINEIFSLNFELDDNEIVKYRILPKSGNVILFAVKKDLLDLLNNKLANYNLYPQTYSFLENHYTTNKLSENATQSKMFVQVFEDFIELVVFDNGLVRFYNTFNYKTNNDILYYIINVFENLKLSQTETSIGFSGFIETDSLAILNLRKFISIVYFESQNIDYKYYYKFQEIAPHYFYNFLNIC